MSKNRSISDKPFRSGETGQGRTPPFDRPPEPLPSTFSFDKTYQAAFGAAVSAAREAGDLLRKEFYRAGGPRGDGGHAEVDQRAEQVIREKILAAFPACYCGEETGSATGGDEDHLWLVDPNDGTSAYLKGWRGSAISIALLRKGVPVLGVVYAFAYPDDNGDLIAWAEGCGPLTRNGARLPPAWATNTSRAATVCRRLSSSRRMRTQIRRPMRPV